MEDSNTYLWEKRHEALYETRLSQLYHKKRERFFDLLDKVTKCVTILLGASLLGAYVKDFIPEIGVAVTSIGLLSLIFSYTDKKQKHKELAEAFAAIQVKIEARGVFDFTDIDVAEWSAEVQRINAKEPPTLGTLVVICQNELAVAEAKPESIVHVGFMSRLLANFRDDFRQAPRTQLTSS